MINRFNYIIGQELQMISITILLFLERFINSYIIHGKCYLM